jgi:FMN phosphatase YigB (HAD superfamily)
MKQAIIFDLDNCLAPATEVGEELFEPAFEAIRTANQELLSPEQLARAFADIWRHPLDWVAQHYGFSDAMLTAAWKVFTGMKVNRPMHGYGDLPVLGSLPVQRFLVTSGFRLLQESKIEALGLRQYFAAMFVDAIDESGRIGKLGHFQRVLELHGFEPCDVLVVGDNASSEIEAGNRLGIATVQTLRPGVPHASNAVFHVQSLSELAALLG